MEIDDQVERHVRRILGTVVKRDEDAFDSSMRELADSSYRSKALELAVAVCAFVLHDTYAGRPSDEEARQASQTIAEMEQWSTLTPEEVRSFLNAVLDGKALDTFLDRDTSVISTFIITGSLLAASPRIGEDEWWFNYLDRVEAAIEAARPS
jgi:hypothetical protein